MLRNYSVKSANYASSAFFGKWTKILLVTMNYWKKKMVAIYLSLPNPLSPFPPLPPLPFDTCDGGQWYA